MTPRRDPPYAALPDGPVEVVVQQRRGRVADERREEDERDDRVREMVVLFDLPSFGEHPDDHLNRPSSERGPRLLT